MPADPFSDTTPDAASKSWFLIAWPCNSVCVAQEARISQPRSPPSTARERPSIVVTQLTLHVHPLLLAERRAELLDLRREAALHVLGRELVVVRAGLRRREGVCRHRAYSLDQSLTLAEVLAPDATDGVSWVRRARREQER